PHADGQRHLVVDPGRKIQDAEEAVAVLRDRELFPLDHETCRVESLKDAASDLRVVYGEKTAARLGGLEGPEFFERDSPASAVRHQTATRRHQMLLKWRNV